MLTHRQHSKRVMPTSVSMTIVPAPMGQCWRRLVSGHHQANARIAGCPLQRFVMGRQHRPKPFGELQIRGVVGGQTVTAGGYDQAADTIDLLGVIGLDTQIAQDRKKCLDGRGIDPLALLPNDKGVRQFRVPQGRDDDSQVLDLGQQGLAGRGHFIFEAPCQRHGHINDDLCLQNRRPSSRSSRQSIPRVRPFPKVRSVSIAPKRRV